MSKRKYTHIQVLEGEILAIRKEGATRQEIADRFGLSKGQIKNWINRYNRKQAKLEAGIMPRPKGDQGKMLLLQR
ncbi:MAG TPA: helix-turn-helix domain-containing protein [Firmicutes bacterium]|nr:helix-turn-helix domain-containing protein [Bacillota bacterium]